MEPPKEIYNRRLFRTSIIISLAAIIIGYDAGFIGGLLSLSSFDDNFKLKQPYYTEHEISIIKETIISNFQIGAIAGCFFFYFVSFKFGPKKALLFSTVFLGLGNILQIVTTKSLTYIYWGRLLTGFAIGGVSNISPMFLSELSPPDYRGTLIGLYEVCWQCGSTIGFWINWFMYKFVPEGNSQWLIPIAVQLIPCFVFLIGLCWIKESPRFLVNSEREDQAIVNLTWLRKLDEDHQYIQHELDHLTKDSYLLNMEIGRGMFDPFKTIFTSHSLRKRLLLSTSLSLFQNLMGINAINYYSPTIFQQMGLSSLNASLLSTGVFGLIKGVCCFIWAFFIVDKFGRRSSNIVGLIVCSLCMWYIGFYVKYNPPSESDGLNGYGKFAVATFYVWTVSYALSWSGSPWVMFAEMFENNVRVATQTINSSSNWFWNFIFARFTASLILVLHYGIFWLFAFGMMVSLVIFILNYPETRCIPLQDIELLFDENVPVWQAHDRVMKILEKRKRAAGFNPNSDNESASMLRSFHSNDELITYSLDPDGPASPGRK